MEAQWELDEQAYILPFKEKFFSSDENCPDPEVFLKKSVSTWFLSSEQEVDGITKIGGIFICMRCGYKTTKCSNALEHYIRKHLPLQLATCHICQKQFKNPIDRDRHRSKEHGITKRMMKEAVQKSKIPLAPSTDDIY